MGVFPALFCVKVIGVTETTGEEIVVRACSIENMDNQCGIFKFESEVLRGCILTCNYDGCNHASSHLTLSHHLLLISLLIFISYSIIHLFV